jgi:hypothetical protein
MKKSLYLDEEEQDLKKALNHGEWHPVKNVKDEIGKHLQYARNTLLKFIASVLHKFAAGRLLSKQH